MKYFLFTIVLGLFSLDVHAQKSAQSDGFTWKSNTGKVFNFKSIDSFYRLPIRNNTLIPKRVIDYFIINSEFLDSLSIEETKLDLYFNQYHPNREAELNVYVNRCLRITVLDNNFKYVYHGSYKIKYDNHFEKVFVLYFNVIDSYQEHYCYQLYCSERIGPFLVYEPGEDHYENQQYKYQLIFNTKDKKRMNQEFLRKLVN